MKIHLVAPGVERWVVVQLAAGVARERAQAGEVHVDWRLVGAPRRLPAPVHRCSHSVLALPLNNVQQLSPSTST